MKSGGDRIMKAGDRIQITVEDVWGWRSDPRCVPDFALITLRCGDEYRIPIIGTEPGRNDNLTLELVEPEQEFIYDGMSLGTDPFWKIVEADV